MTRSFSSLTIIALAALTLGAAVAHAQTTPPSPSNCGVETWSTDKMMYVGTPCPSGITYENPSAPPQQ